MKNALWHALPAADVCKEFRADERGLAAGEATRRLAAHGPNRLPESKPDRLPVLFFRQFKSPLIYLLLAASAIVYATGAPTDSLLILAVLIFNAIVGTIQEGKAQDTLRALKRFVETSATVRRAGGERVVPDSDVVPGDVVLLHEGERVPADARIIHSRNLTVDESALTGESVPVHKISEPLEAARVEIADQKNMVFRGTYVASGAGSAMVVATGTGTVIGAIAKKIALIDTEIPLKKEIRDLSKIIIAAVGVVGTAIFIIGVATGKPPSEMFATIVTLAVSVIPEGLPIVLTLVLATGVARMVKRNVLVKRLQAVEALGQTRVLAVDKTGTITRNELVIQTVYAENTFFSVSGNGYDPRGKILPSPSPALIAVARITARLSNAHIAPGGTRGTWRVAGDPTEAALTVFAKKLGITKDALERVSPLLGEIPFDYKRKFHAILYADAGTRMIAAIGAPEAILERATHEVRGDAVAPLDTTKRRELEQLSIALSKKGLRVLALGVRQNAPAELRADDVRGLAVVAFFGMRDALRHEVAESVARAAAAGITVVMITGDHRETAQAIAAEAGIFKTGDATLTGKNIDELTDPLLQRALQTATVFARVTPEHKLRIINAYRARGDVVAMTGDGVNDAPSLVAADLGIAMGGIGTEVAKEAADLVLLDDNIGSIVAAAEEGRSIYRTIKKVILYLFSTSIGEVLTITGALLIGFPLPILPGQIIWLNFVTDGFLDVALAMEPKERGLLRGAFGAQKKYLVDKLMGQRMITMAVPMAVGSLALFYDYLISSPAKAGTVALTTLAVFQWLNAWNCRSGDKSAFQMKLFSNPFLVAATAVVIVLQLLAVYHPWMQRVLHTTALSPADWLRIIPVAASIILIEEFRKLLIRTRVLRPASEG